MRQTYDLIVFIGRFQPLHDGHINTIKAALKYGEQVLVLVGSSYAARSTKNPFSFQERKGMIKDQFHYEALQAKSLHVEPLIDTVYNDAAWVNQVRFKAMEKCPKGKIAIIGHVKDESSYYLKMFPDWDLIETDEISKPNGDLFHSTEIRQDMFEYCSSESAQKAKSVLEKAGAFYDLQEEHVYLQKYKMSWAKSPFAPTFNCSDAVVIQSGHILLVQRDGLPGKGNYAIPGGFIEPSETSLDAAIRELREETKLKIPEKVLKGSLFDSKVFDAPGRSSRGRTFSHSFGFKLDDSQPLPEVRGSDDARKAVWVPFEVFHTTEFRQKMFEDHASILDWYLSRI